MMMKKYEQVEELLGYCDSKLLTAVKVNPYLKSVDSSEISEEKKAEIIDKKQPAKSGEKVFSLKRLYLID